MKLHLVAYGKLKTPGLREAADQYLKQLRPWVQLEETELKPISVPDKSPATRLRVQEKETEQLKQWLAQKVGPRGAYYVLDETGKALPTQGWAEMVRGWEAGSLPDVALFVGSSLGFHPDFRRAARGVLSLGPQTLPHELARVVVFEQIYRAFSVVRGHPYHNEG